MATLGPARTARSSYNRYYNAENLEPVSWTTWIYGPAQRHTTDLPSLDGRGSTPS
jgi:hypothetical protein